MYVKSKVRKARAVPGTLGAAAPFFSRDGQWLGFATAGSSFKASLNGGSVLNLGLLSFGQGSYWAADGAITFGSTAGLQQVRDSGGTPVTIAAAGYLGVVAEGSQAHVVPGHTGDRERAPGGLAVTRVLDRLAITRGLPRVLRTDNALEFCGRAMLTWAHERRVTLRLIEPCKPNQNAYIESFNGRFRDECLNEHWCTSLGHAQVVIEA